MKRLLIFALVAVSAASQALLVADNGTNVGTGDDSAFAITLGGTFNFYGTNYTSMFVGTNGYICSPSTTNLGPNFPLTGIAMIAPFGDDLDSRAAGMYTDFGSTGTYDQVTWNTQHFSQTGNLLMQAVLFRSNTTVSGFNFLAGDIAFSYDSISDTSGSLFNGTVGVNSGTGSFTAGPGCSVTQGTFGSALPIFPTSRQFFLFRPNANGGYDSSVQTAPVPEPASMAILGMGALALLRRRRKA